VESVGLKGFSDPISFVRLLSLGILLAMPATREKSVTREGLAEPLGFAWLTPDRK
jgi:hypothetical protein